MGGALSRPDRMGAAVVRRARSPRSTRRPSTLTTEFGTHRADVANVIPPQRAGAIAAIAGVADRTGWCPIDPVTFESRLQPGIHVIGDAAIAGAMPKSAFAANAQAKACAAAVAALLRDRAPARAEADQHLLQPRGARLRHLRRRRLPAGERPAGRRRGRRRREPARMPRRFRALRSGLRGGLVRDHHRRRLRMRRRRLHGAAAQLACCPAWRGTAAAYTVVGRRHPACR